jgi:hypothetical protein
LQSAVCCAAGAPCPAKTAVAALCCAVTCCAGAASDQQCEDGPLWQHQARQCGDSHTLSVRHAAPEGHRLREWQCCVLHGDGRVGKKGQQVDCNPPRLARWAVRMSLRILLLVRLLLIVNIGDSAAAAGVLKVGGIRQEGLTAESRSVAVCAAAAPFFGVLYRSGGWPPCCAVCRQ